MTVIVTSILSNTDSLYRFELLLPDNWKESPCPVYIQLAGTGDHVSFCRLTEARIISVSSVFLEKTSFVWSSACQVIFNWITDT